MNHFIVKKQEGYTKNCTTPDTCAYEGCRCSRGSSYTYYVIYDTKKKDFVYKYEGNQRTLREIAKHLNKKDK